MTIENFHKPLHITLLLITLTLVSAAANRILGFKPNPPTLFTFDLEAEQGLLIPPMVISSTASASGEAYLSSEIRDEGIVTFSVNLANDGHYVVWGRVLAPDYNQDSFFVSIDGGPEDIYDVARGTWSDSWQWSKVNGRSDAGSPLTVNPRIFELTAGNHVIVFRGREPDTKLDRLIITNDLGFVPDDADPAPSPTPPPSPVGRQFYVSPQGRPHGDGSQSNPWDLTTAMNHPSSVRPGDLIYLRGGTYRLDSTSEPDTSYWEVAGTAAQPTTVRNYPGERAIIDIDYQLRLLGAHVRYIGLEFITSRTKKVFVSGWSPDRPGSVDFVGDNLKVINCIFHDMAGTSAFADAENLEMYGNIMYYIGFIAEERSWGTTAYIQNVSGRKDVTDNIMFQQFSHNLQVYGSDAARIRDVYMEGNTIFNPGALGTNRGFNSVVWVGEQAVERIKFSNNYLYSPYEDGSNAVFWGAGGVVNRDLTITGNQIIGGAPALRLGVWDPVTFTDNTISGRVGLAWYEGSLPQNRLYNWDNNKYFNQGSSPPFQFASNSYDFNGWRPATGLDTNSTFTAARPTGIKIFVRPNKYERGRAHITIINWTNQATALVNLSNTGLAIGQQFEIRDVQNYFGAPVASGRFNGATVHLPLNLTAVTPILGAGLPGNEALRQPVHTTQEFNVFVVVPR